MKKIHKQRLHCLNILRDRNVIIPKNHDDMFKLVMSSSVIGVCFDILGYLDEYPDIKEYISNRGGFIGKDDLGNPICLRDVLEAFQDDYFIEKKEAT